MGSPTISFISIGKQKAYLSWLNWKFLIIPLLSFGTWQNCRSAGLSSSAVLHVVNASPSSSLLSSSVVLPREVKMLAIVTAALLVLAANAEAAFVKYDYGGRESYKHEDYDSYEHKRGDDYPEPSHKSHYADQYYGHMPSYEIQDYSHRPHHDSYDEDHYGRDAYSVVPSYSHESSSPSYKQYEPRSYRKRSVTEEAGVTESQAMEETMARDALQSRCPECRECAKCRRNVGTRQACTPTRMNRYCGMCPVGSNFWLNCGCSIRCNRCNNRC